MAPKKKVRLWPKIAEDYLIEKLALNWPVSMLRREIRDLHGVSVEAQQLYVFARKRRAKIEQLRKKLSQRLERHAMASKLVRLEALELALEEARTPRLVRYVDRKGPLCRPDGSLVLDDTGKPVMDTISVPIFDTSPQLVPAIVREARIEMEGEAPAVDMRQQIVQVYTPAIAKDDEAIAASLRAAAITAKKGAAR